MQLLHRSTRRIRCASGCTFDGITCADTDNPRDPFAFPRAAARRDRKAPYFGAQWAYGSIACADWPARDDDRYTGPWTARTAHPVLLVNTRYDPATPLSGARAAARLLPWSRLLVVNSWGHTTLPWGGTCAERVQARYLVDLRVPRTGRVCSADVGPFDPAAHAAQLRSTSIASHLWVGRRS